MSDETTTQKTLEAFFGLTSFRPNQEAIIADILSGRDVLAIMATGGGKSLCYQLPAVKLGGLSVVVSPLIALMKDQVDSLLDQGIEAALLTSSQTYDQRKAVEADIRRGNVRILYVSPERMALPPFQQLLREAGPKLFAIDEAHCISHWGHQFREDYRSLSLIRDTFPEVPIIALTATATEEVRDDIIRELRLRSPSRYIGSFDRENIRYTVREVATEKERFRRLVQFISNNHPGSGIVYCRSRKSVEETAENLRERGIPALPYHAGLSANERIRVQNAFLRGEIRVISATVAFGMGIDKPDVRFVAHYHPPKDIESFYQESGRAGRDGKPSESLLLYSRSDFIIAEKLITQEYHGRENYPVRLANLSRMAAWCSRDGCRRCSLLAHFGEKYPASRCGNCDGCDALKRENKAGKR